MKITVSEIGGIAVNKKHLTLRVYTAQPITKRDVPKSAFSRLDIGGNKFACTVHSTISTEDRTELTLKFADDRAILAGLHAVHHQQAEGALFVEEKVDLDVFKQADTLLGDLVKFTGQSKARLLINLTSFKPGAGRDDLRFVSEKQLAVITDKMRERLGRNNERSAPKSS